jgi:hypothetical protein
MEALNDPLLMQSGGKKKGGLYNPEDDKALMRLLDNIEAQNKGHGGANLEQRLIDAGDPATKMVYFAQFNKFLESVGTPVSDFIPMQRIVGYMEM